MEHQISHKGKTIKYQLIRQQVKNINLRIKTDGTIWISAHPKITQKDIEDFMIFKWDWILKVSARLNARPDLSLLQDHIYLFGKAYQVELRKGSKRVMVNEHIIIFYPNLEDHQGISKFIRGWLIKYLEQTVNEIRNVYDRIMDDYHHEYPLINYRSMSTRWGSCLYHKNKITLNTNLVHYPLNCLHYVMLHEYLHFVVANHSKRFYDLLAYHMPEYKRYKELLNNFSG